MSLKHIFDHGIDFLLPIGYDILILAREQAYNWTNKKKHSFILQAATKFNYQM